MLPAVITPAALLYYVHHMFSGAPLRPHYFNKLCQPLYGATYGISGYYFNSHYPQESRVELTRPGLGFIFFAPSSILSLLQG